MPDIPMPGFEPFEATNDPEKLKLAKLEKITGVLDSLCKRMDALEARRQPGARKAGEQALADALRGGNFNAAEVLQKSAEEDRACTDAQARADSIYMHVGRKAPPAGPYERATTYRARLLNALARYSSDASIQKIRFDGLSAPALKNFEDQIFADILSRADAILVDARPGEMMKRERRDPLSGQKYVEYFGRNTFIKDMQPPRMRAVLHPPYYFRGWKGR
jgi:hypothetical protein